jgi:hypothetical protein
MTNAAAKTPARILATCDKCEGKGYINGFGHYANGVCFLCEGNGTRYVTAHEAKISAETAARIAAAAVENDKRAAFIARFDGVEPRLVVARFRTYTADQVWAIRQHCAGTTTRGASPGERVCYWAASTVLDAWPMGTAYPESWVYAA